MYIALIALPNFATDTTGDLKGKLFNDARCTGVSVPVYNSVDGAFATDADGKQIVVPMTSYVCEVGLQVVKAFHILTILATFLGMFQFYHLDLHVDHIQVSHLFFWTWISPLISFLVYNSIYSQLAWDAGVTWTQTSIKDGQLYILFIVTIVMSLFAHFIYIVLQIVYWDNYDKMKTNRVKSFLWNVLSLALFGGVGAAFRKKLNEGDEKRNESAREKNVLPNISTSSKRLNAAYGPV